MSRANSIRGNGLFQAHSALQALVDDPHHLDRARSRFSKSPASYKSHKSQSGTPTRSPSPDNRTDEERRREEREWELRREHMASRPRCQFNAQTNEETRQIKQDNYDRTHRVLTGPFFCELAKDIVKKRWVEQGIWNKKWETSHDWLWKHEEPPTPEPPDEEEGLVSTSSENGVEARMKNGGQEHATCATQERRQQERERERDASRPFHQFVFQLTKMRERMQERMTPAEVIASLPADINSKAYEEVKKTWIEWGIWNMKWGIMPGMSWKHEQPLEKFLQEEFGEDFRLPEWQKRPTIPLKSDFSPPQPAIANQQVSKALNSSSSLVQPGPLPPATVWSRSYPSRTKAYHEAAKAPSLAANSHQSPGASERCEPAPKRHL
ncbi:hypothetical protein F4777DRAFT_192618 [Nemania sp. FL0916]|nr:hypothetical protein F4777DRAFT_192618 [Nemania sp. FL0916]